VPVLEKSKYETFQSEPDLSQATSFSIEDSTSQLRTSDEAGSDKMPISIKDSSPPMPRLKSRNRRFTTNVDPIRYTHHSDYDNGAQTWHNESYMPADQLNYRSTSLSPSRSVSMKLAPNDPYGNDMGTMRKVKYGKSGSGKNVHSLKNSLAAFFSKRKNEQRFGATNTIGVSPTSTIRRIPGGTSYSYWPGSYGDNNSEIGSVRSSITLASNPNVRLLAGSIPRPQFIPSPRQNRNTNQSYGKV
jgi:hypothetical protein